jgi:hypothetical protein
VAWFEKDVDLIMSSKETLRLPLRLEPSHDLLSPLGGAVTALNPIAQAFVRAVIWVKCPLTDRLEVTAQLIGDNHPRLAILCDQI